MAKLKSYPQASDVKEWARQVSIIREDDRRVLNNLENTFLRARLRTDRVAPATYDDVQPPDKEHDIIMASDYLYFLVNDSGTLKWARVAVSVSW